MAISTQKYDDAVFINCPFDDEYKSIFNTIIFTVFDCGFVARSALEFSDAAEVRIEKIMRIISECKYGIHDICRTELDPKTKLPRFNMPLKLGMFLGARRFGDKKQRSKICIVMDVEQYRFRDFISDIAGQDISAHGNDEKSVVSLIRNSLRDASRRTNIPGGAEIYARYTSFQNDFPSICIEAKIREDEITFNDYATFISEWLKKVVV